MSTLVAQTISNGTVSTSTANVINGAKVWLNYNGSTQTIRSSYNVSSVTRNSTGIYTVNFTTAISDANYSFQLTASNVDGAAWGLGLETNAPSTTALRFYTQAFNTNYFDPTYVCVAVFR